MGRKRTEKREIPVIVVGDTHIHSKLGLCHPDGCGNDDGGPYMPSNAQRAMWVRWEEFWGEWVPMVTKGGPFAVVHIGDATDGVHHGTTTTISNNLQDQANHAYRVLRPIVEACEGRYYHIRGTEAHVGQSAQEEERLAQRLGAIPNSEGQHARWELWLQVGNDLCHFMHHIGTTGSSAYELTAVYKEFVEMCVEAGRWGRELPQAVIRGHRHRYAESRVATHKGYGVCVVAPGWQLKTPFTFKIAGARVSQPQIGGLFIGYGDEDGLYTRSRVWDVGPPKIETLS